jgi:hypothetical protein
MSMLDSSVICFDSDKTFSGRSSGYQSQICSSIQRPDATRFILSGGASGVQLISTLFLAYNPACPKFANGFFRDF